MNHAGSLETEMGVATIAARHETCPPGIKPEADILPEGLGKERLWAELDLVAKNTDLSQFELGQEFSTTVPGVKVKFDIYGALFSSNDHNFRERRVERRSIRGPLGDALDRVIDSGRKSARS